ncbi:MAG: hypothetical protein SYC29_14240 [Planctomycetota bacterium]|nr:hypothetical protein [Planctomycetota bacterium]
MKRLSDVSMICVALALAVAALVGPPPGDPDSPIASSPSTASTTAAPAPDRAEEDRAQPRRERWTDRRDPDVLDVQPEPWSRRADAPRFARKTPPQLTPELIDACLAVARDLDLQLAAELRRMRKEDPGQFERRLRHSRRLIALAELRERDPALYDLKKLELNVDAEVVRLARETRTARREGRLADAKILEKQLRGQVILQLGFAIKNREDYLCRLQELVERLEHELARQREPENFDRAVELRMQQLLSDPSVDERDRPAGGGEPPPR